MKKLRKITSYLIIISFFITLLPISTFADYSESDVDQTDVKMVVYDEASETVSVYESDDKTSEPLNDLEIGSVVSVVEKFEQYTQVQYENIETEELIVGFIENQYLLTLEEYAQITTDSLTNEGETTHEQQELVSEDESNVTSENDVVNEENLELVERKVDGEEIAEDSAKVNATISTFSAASAPVALYGVAIKDPTNMYSQPSRDSEVLRTFNAGKSLKFYSYSSDWYFSYVTVNGKTATIYIHKDDVVNKTKEPVTSHGIALKDPTKMYQAPTRDSKALRTFQQGKKLKLYDFSDDWYFSYVNVNGKTTTIYIHKDDVALPTTSAKVLNGIAVKNPTNMYQAPARNAKVLRTFNKGKFLKFYTFSDDWYFSYVNVNGKTTTIYIHKDDVELPTTNPKVSYGIALKNPTNMYETPSRDSKALRTFPAGKELKYYTYTSDWYFSYVTVNGKVETIYINKADVEPLVEKPERQEGIGWKNPTNMYASPSRSSKVLRTFRPGWILKFDTYSTNWYKSTTTVNGKVTTIYIHKNDVELANPSTKAEEGLALKSPTNAYEIPSSSAKVLRKFNKGTFLKFYNYSKNWYYAYVWVDGKGYEKAYIKKSDVTTSGLVIKNSHYDIDFNEFVTIQANNSPKVDGQARYTASRELVAYYANPKNFDQNSKEYFQFLDLSVPLNLTKADAEIINEKILKGKNKLEGTAEVFIEAGKKHGVNALYLIAHAIHETGHGTSSLAKGIKVNGKTVYNFFGYAAYDGSADGSGSTFAYNKGWFTPEAAIEGGIEIIARSYIYRSNGHQNTLYKMKWNPERPGHHQYATHVMWATAQTDLIYSYYKTLGITQYVFDVPTFKNQPGKTNEPTGEARYAVLNVPSGLTGTLTTNVNFRTYPNGNLIKTLPKGTVVNIIGANGGWYKATHNGKNGWLSGDYVSVLNGLEVTASALNVRSSPNGTSSIVGVVYQGEIVKAILNNSGNYIKSGNWYQIKLNNTTGWVSGTYVKELRR